MTDNRWPKKWDEIKPSTDSPWSQIGNFHMEFMDGMRGYNGTLYVSVDIGEETESNRDLWVPLDRYLEDNA